MSFFDKLKQGLSGTRAAVKDRINTVFAAFTAIDEDLFEELCDALIMADAGADTAEDITETLRERVKQKRITDPKLVKEELFAIISEILKSNDSTLRLTTTPSVVLVVGVNGAGKTTSIGKLAARLTTQGKTVVLAAGDTFRAAAGEQLSIWAQRAGASIVKHEEGADPAAVVYDAISSAKAKKADVLICDTAGRLHNKKNLMDELNKIYRVIKRELPEAALETLLVLDATTGQNAVLQAKEFARHSELSGIILTKLDGTAKGGIVISVCRDKNIPVKFIGIGEGKDDFEEFNAEEFASALLL